MSQIATAVAIVEQLDDIGVQQLIWETHIKGKQIDSFLLRRDFRDPRFPQKMDEALRTVTARHGQRYLH